MPNKKRLLSAVGTFFKNLFTKNIPIKIVALMFGLLLWGYVLTIENPEYNKVVRDVEITMTGEEALSEKGLMLVTREFGTTDVSVLCEISKHSELDASRISCVIDLSGRAISLAEDEDSKVIPLTVITSIQSGYGTISSVEHSTVNVEVARVATRTNLPIGIEYTGAIPDGFQILVPDRLTITVSGRKSLVDEIAKGVVTIDLDTFPINDPETLAGEYSGVYPVQFYNGSNVGLEGIHANNGESYSIEVPITIRAYREVTIEPNIVVEEGYETIATLSRNTVILYGERGLLQEIESIATEPITAQADMAAEEIVTNLILPEGVSTSTGDNGKVTVTLTVIEKIETLDLTVPIQVVGLSETLMRGENFPIETQIRVTGTHRMLEAFSSTLATVSLNLSGCAAGEHTLPLQLDIDARAGNVTVELVANNVTVTLIDAPSTTGR